MAHDLQGNRAERSEAAGSGPKREGLQKPRSPEGAKSWTGPTYYGRQQLRPAPFHKSLVGGYIFLAGLSGSASLIGALAGLLGGRPFAGVARRARSLSLLAPTLGSVLLIWDLHSPKRFYNMLRVAKPRSPMSIGTWILMAFSGSALPAALAGALADRVGLRWARPIARVAEIPAATSGAGLSVYTAALLSATSAPAWASAPEALGVRFGASSVASAASALLLGARTPEARRALTGVGAVALAAEMLAMRSQGRAHKEAGIAALEDTKWGRVERVGVGGLGTALPLALLGAALALGPRSRAARALETSAACLTLLGSALLRVSTLGVGEASSADPHISFRFASPDNLPDVEERVAFARSRPDGLAQIAHRPPP